MSTTQNRAMKTIKIADGQVWMMRGLHAVITAVGDLILYTMSPAYIVLVPESRFLLEIQEET